MNFSKMMVISVVALLAFSPVMAQNGNGKGKGNGNGGGKHAKIAMEMGFTQDQMKQLATLRQKNRTEMEPLHQQVSEVRNTISDLLKADVPDRAAISKESSKIADLHKQLQEKRIDHLLEVKKIMNKEQWIKFLDREKEGGKHMGNWQGKGQGTCNVQGACNGKGMHTGHGNK